MRLLEIKNVPQQTLDRHSDYDFLTTLNGSAFAPLLTRQAAIRIAGKNIKLFRVESITAITAITANGNSNTFCRAIANIGVQINVR